MMTTAAPIHTIPGMNPLDFSGSVQVRGRMWNVARARGQINK